MAQPAISPRMRAVGIAGVAGVVVTGALVGAQVIDRSESGRSARDASAMKAFRAELDPLVDRGGQVVVAGLQAGLDDIAADSLEPAVLQRMADGWVAELDAIRADAEALEPPHALEDAHWLYVRSFRSYVSAATAARAAAIAPEENEQELLDLAASLGREADELFDRAEATVEREADR